MPKKFKLEVSKLKTIFWNRAHIASADKDDSDPESFRPKLANIVKKLV